jgi:transposase-like protein
MRNTRSENKADSRRRWRVWEAEAIVGEYEKSGLTQRVFARKNGIGVSTLQYWLRRRGRRSSASTGTQTWSAKATREVSLLEVDVKGVPRVGSAGEERYELEWADGMRLRVPRGFGKEELKALLELVKEGR